MAGSFNHVTTKSGKLRKPDKMLIDNLGDAYEAYEEMYGMIWILADEIASTQFGSQADPRLHISYAHERYAQGLKIAERELKKK